MVDRLCVIRVPIVVIWILSVAGASAFPKMENSEPNVFSNPNITFLLYPTPESLEEPPTGDPDVLIPQHPLTLVFHGFKGDRTAKSMVMLKEALLENGVQNVVLVDWGPLADAPNQTALDSYKYVVAYGVRDAAVLVHEWLVEVMEMKGISPDMIHLIGFSLGAHLVGLVGNLFKGSVGRISALDPPKFGYEKTSYEERLNAEDAQFVNVIHTSGAILSYPEPIGHVDFFPNGDTVPQVGCPEESPIHILTCSHYFSFTVFTETIFNRDAFLATQCESWQGYMHGDCADRLKAPMGYYTPADTRGSYYMETKDKPPFGEESVDNPLPEGLKGMLTYNKDESFVKPVDVVNFLMQTEETDLAELGEEEVEQHKVMKVKSKSSTTTPSPPAFMNGVGLSKALDFLLLALASMNLFRIVFDWMSR